MRWVSSKLKPRVVDRARPRRSRVHPAVAGGSGTCEAQRLGRTVRGLISYVLDPPGPTSPECIRSCRIRWAIILKHDVGHGVPPGCWLTWDRRSCLRSVLVEPSSSEVGDPEAGWFLRDGSLRRH